MDNNSTDNSVKIAKSFDNTEIIPYNSDNQVRDDIYLRLKNQVWKISQGVADYVIVGDADEFLYHTDIVKFLTDSFENGVTIFKPEGYHMIGDETLNLTDSDNIFETVKQGVRTPVLDKMLMFDCNKIKEINYSFGCHSANPIGEIKLMDNTDLKMLHYKFLGIENHLYKHSLRRERLSDFNKKYGLGSYYLYTDEENIQDYKNYIEKRKLVLV